MEGRLGETEGLKETEEEGAYSSQVKACFGNLNQVT